MNFPAISINNFDDVPRLEPGAVRPPPARGAGIKVKTVEELVTELQGRGLI